MPNAQHVISQLLPQPESVSSLVQVVVFHVFSSGDSSSVVAHVFRLGDSKFNTQSASQHDYSVRNIRPAK